MKKILSISALALGLAAFGARAQQTTTSAPPSPATSTDSSATGTTQTTDDKGSLNKPVDSAAMPSTSDSQVAPSADATKNADGTMKTDDSTLQGDSSATIKHRSAQGKTGTSMRHRAKKLPSDSSTSDSSATLPDSTTGSVAAPSGDMKGTIDEKGATGSGDLNGAGTTARPAAPSTTDDTAAKPSSNGPGDVTGQPDQGTTSAPNSVTTQPAPSAPAPAPADSNSNSK